MSDVGLIVPDWPAPPRVRAAFTLRTGGVSAGPFASLNVGAHVGDSPAAVAENRRLIRERLALPSEPVWLQQVHGTAVLDLDAVEQTSGPRQAVPGQADVGSSRRGALGSGVAQPGPSPPADAVVTRQAGRVCVIQVADCMPVLFAAADGSAVGAAHAGWRGLAGGVLDATVRQLGVEPARLIAWLGPAIGQAHFEVGDEVRTAFTAGDPDAASAFVANFRGRWQCDLYALAWRRLAALGVTAVYGGAGQDGAGDGRGGVGGRQGGVLRSAGWCTYADDARFFSFRRDGQCGRMAALIRLEPLTGMLRSPGP